MDETQLKQDAAKVGTEAQQVAQTAATDAKAGVSWLAAHPDVYKILAGLVVGIAIGYALFHG